MVGIRRTTGRTISLAATDVEEGRERVYQLRDFSRRLRAAFDKFRTVPSSAPNRYTARICWNSNWWGFREAQQLEEGGYVVDSGFGHEEWIFNLTWLINITGSSSPSPNPSRRSAVGHFGAAHLSQPARRDIWQACGGRSACAVRFCARTIAPRSGGGVVR
jgi:hypothetical protein